MNALEMPLKPARARPARRGGKMSREEAYYWGLWREIFEKFNVPPAEQSEWRRDLRKQVLGSDRTQATFTHGDYDVVLGAMRELLAQASLVVYPEKIVQMHMDGEARRIARLIDDLDMPPAYVAAVSLGKFGTRDWRNGLLAFEMMQLLYTCKARLRAREKSGKTFAAPAADQDNCPF